MRQGKKNGKSGRGKKKRAGGRVKKPLLATFAVSEVTVNIRKNRSARNNVMVLTSYWQKDNSVGKIYIYGY